MQCDCAPRTGFATFGEMIESSLGPRHQLDQLKRCLRLKIESKSTNNHALARPVLTS